MPVPQFARSKPFAILISVVIIVLFAMLESDRRSKELTLGEYLFGVSVPDFAEIEDVKQKKAAFFDFFRPIVEKENQRMLALREKLQALAEKDSLSSGDEAWLTELAETYRAEVSEPVSKSNIKQLLQRVDTIPVSLVLSQAAIESAWGTSRFAREGYNYFGQWCFSKGCGLVPSQRSAGAYHEVQKFPAPRAAVKAYFRNLNSHPTYDTLRLERAQARAKGAEPRACQLATGLQKYSERGMHYVNEVRAMIRINKTLMDTKAEGCGDIATS